MFLMIAVSFIVIGVLCSAEKLVDEETIYFAEIWITNIVIKCLVL